MKKTKIYVCFFERIVMPSTKFMISSMARCKRPSPLLWIAKRCTLSRRDNASLAMADSILLFVNVQEISFSSKSQHKSMCQRRKNYSWSRCGLEIPDKYIFYGNEETIQ